MRLKVSDAASLRALKPMEVVSYLRSRGWTQEEQQQGRVAIWTLQKEEVGTFEVLVPLSRDFRDIELRMAELLHVLEKSEDRSQMEILRDIESSGMDVVRLRLDEASLAGGSIPMEVGVESVERTYDLIFAAACSAALPRSAFHSRRPRQAVEYMRTVRLGQTEQGSFVLSVRCPVPPQLAAEESGSEEPFGRRVTTTLVTAMTRLRDAAVEATVRGDLAPFTAGVPAGISANLCEAAASLIASSSSDSLELNVSWSPSRPAAESLPRRVRIGSDSVPVLEEAARLFRERAPRDDFELRGHVVRLQRADGSVRGCVTIDGLIDGDLRRIRMELEGEDYTRAVEAHRERRRIACTGVLLKERRSYLLQNPRAVVVLGEDDEG